MCKWRKMIGRFLYAEEGPTAVEYAFMLALLILVCVVVIASIGTKTVNMYDNLGLKAALGAS